MLTLALGIGANAAIFTVVNGVLLQPLPYPDPDRIMMVWTHNPRQGFDKDVGTYPNFEDWRRASQSFERMSGYFGTSVTLTGSGDPAQIQGARVTHEFFETMGVVPFQGRAFTSANGQAGGERVVVLAHGLWTRRFGGDVAVVGRTIVLNGVSHEVVGVMPPSFKHPADAELWIPLAPVGQFAELFRARGSFWLTIVGRLKPGVTRAAAQSEMDTIAARLEKDDPSNAGIGIRLVTLHEELVGDVKRPLLILLGAVCFVLLIACANVANLLLTRAASRRRELAIRAALGANRGRLVRQLLTESLVLGVAAAGSSLLLSRLPESASINIEGRPSLPANARNIPVPYDSVTPEFFSTLQIPLRRGRMFSHADGPQSQPVVLVNEAFVRRFFPGEDPLGRRVTFGNPSRPDTQWQTIVGVVADTKRGGFEREPWAETYFPMRQAPDSRAFVLLRSNGDPTTLIAAAQAAVWSIDRNQAIASIRTVPDLLAQQELNRRFTTLLLGLFAAVALVLAIIGTYGVIAHTTAQRTQEIGIRIALGADRATILTMVLAGGLRIAAAGLAIGVFGALALTHVLSGLLFGVTARDPLTFVLLVVALAACWIPARRAMHVEPVVALRGDG